MLQLLSLQDSFSFASPSLRPLSIRIIIHTPFGGWVGNKQSRHRFKFPLVVFVILTEASFQVDHFRLAFFFTHLRVGGWAKTIPASFQFSPCDVRDTNCSQIRPISTRISLHAPLGGWVGNSNRGIVSNPPFVVRAVLTSARFDRSPNSWGGTRVAAGTHLSLCSSRLQITC